MKKILLSIFLLVSLQVNAIGPSPTDPTGDPAGGNGGPVELPPGDPQTNPGTIPIVPVPPIAPNFGFPRKPANSVPSQSSPTKKLIVMDDLCSTKTLCVAAKLAARQCDYVVASCVAAFVTATGK